MILSKRKNAFECCTETLNSFMRDTVRDSDFLVVF